MIWLEHLWFRPAKTLCLHLKLLQLISSDILSPTCWRGDAVKIKALWWFTFLEYLHMSRSQPVYPLCFWCFPFPCVCVCVCVCVCDVGVVLLSLSRLPDCCPVYKHAIHQLIYSAVYQPCFFIHSSPDRCFSHCGRSRLRPLWIVHSKLSLSCCFVRWTNLVSLCHRITAWLPVFLLFSLPADQSSCRLVY